MCKIKSRFRKSTTFTGYKIVVVRRDSSNRRHYHSPLTGLEYKINADVKPVTMAEINSEFKIHSWTLKALDPSSKFYCKLMKGKTGVFVNLNDALECYDSDSAEEVVDAIESCYDDGEDVEDIEDDE